MDLHRRDKGASLNFYGFTLFSNNKFHNSNERMLNSHLFHEKELVILESLVNCNEHLVAACPISTDTSLKKIAALTSSALRIVDLIQIYNWNFTRDCKLLREQMIALVNISNLTIENVENRFVQTSFFINGNLIRYSFRDYSEGVILANKLNNALRSPSILQAPISDQIEKLSQLFRAKILSLDEYEKVKEKMLAGDVNQIEQATQLLQNLYTLNCRGALTDSEFQIKKWDVLSKNLIA